MKSLEEVNPQRQKSTGGCQGLRVWVGNGELLLNGQHSDENILKQIMVMVYITVNVLNANNLCPEK